MHFLKEIPVHEMLKLRKERRKEKKSKRRKEEWKKERRKERRVEEGKKSGRTKEEEWKKERIIFLVIQLNGEGQREEEPWNLGTGKHRCKPV